MRIPQEYHCRGYSCIRQGATHEREYGTTRTGIRTRQKYGTGSTTEPVEIQSEKTSPVKPRKKKDEAGSYRDKYLVNIPASNRSHVYINREVAECIKRILPVIAPDMSISGYISNILVDHIQSIGRKSANCITKNITNH